MFQAWETFPLWDTARRAARGADLAVVLTRDGGRHGGDDADARLPTRTRGRPAELTVEQVQTASRDNRYVGWPYTKHEVSVMDVDMAAALLVMTVEKADALGIPADKRVHLASSSYAEDPAGIAERDRHGGVGGDADHRSRLP